MCQICKTIFEQNLNLNRCIDNRIKTVIIISMKRILIIIGLILSISGIYAEELENISLDVRDYNAVEVPAGTFIPVMNTQEISTQYCPEGYKVKFIVTNDMYMHDTVIFPKESEIYGYVEALHDPVIGTNASMKIRITQLVYPDGVSVPIKGYLYNSNNNIFGGGISEPVKYIKMAQRQVKVHYTTLQIRPSYKRKMGVHTVIPTGSNEIVVLTAPAEITHTLTN